MGIEIIKDYGCFHDGRILKTIIDKQEKSIALHLKNVNFDWEYAEGYIPEPGILLFQEVTSYEIIMKDRQSWDWITDIKVTLLDNGYRAEIWTPDDCEHFLTIEFGDLQLIPVGKKEFEFKPPID